MQAADAFEKIIARQCTASYAYYAALSNHAAHRENRARQLFEYVSKTFPNSVEGGYSRRMLATIGGASPSGSSGSSSGGSSADDLPESVRALLPANMQGMLNTPEGRRAIADAMKQNSDKIDAIRQAESTGQVSGKKVIAVGLAPSSLTPTLERGSGQGDHPFTAADIAKLGAHAIDQAGHPNCWFECSMAALAELPRGQRLIASMISKRDDKYIVRFPQDGQEYKISMDDLHSEGIEDRALWASLIECAQTRKFPDNRGAEGSTGDMSRLEVGLGCITGAKAEVLDNLREMSEGQLSSFIGGAISSHNPVVCGTWHNFGAAPTLVVPTHAYTVVGFEPSRNLVTIRNPWGRNPAFQVGDTPKTEFEMLGDGQFKMSLRLFKHYFYSVARSFI